VQVVDDDVPFMGLLSVDHLQDVISGKLASRSCVLRSSSWKRGSAEEACWKRFSRCESAGTRPRCGGVRASRLLTRRILLRALSVICRPMRGEIAAHAALRAASAIYSCNFLPSS
jgi:hypothetical protein